MAPAPVDPERVDVHALLRALLLLLHPRALVHGVRVLLLGHRIQDRRGRRILDLRRILDQPVDVDHADRRGVGDDPLGVVERVVAELARRLA